MALNWDDDEQAWSWVDRERYEVGESLLFPFDGLSCGAPLRVYVIRSAPSGNPEAPWRHFGSESREPERQPLPTPEVDIDSGPIFGPMVIEALKRITRSEVQA